MNKIQRSESFHLAIILAVIGKYLDAYTYFCRDRVCSNAQIGNIVKLGISLGVQLSALHILSKFLNVFDLSFPNYSIILIIKFAITITSILFKLFKLYP